MTYLDKNENVFLCIVPKSHGAHRVRPTHFSFVKNIRHFYYKTF